LDNRRRGLPVGWYPDDEKECKEFIERCVKNVDQRKVDVDGRFGGIVPHAGWYYSGELAAKVFYLLSAKTTPDVVVLYGGHLSELDLPYIITERSWETPFGEMEIEQNLVNKVMEEIVCEEESINTVDNTIEIQLAFVKYFFPESKLLAIRSPPSERAVDLGEKVASISQQDQISIIAIGSTDLTHYGLNYGFYPKGVGKESVDWVKNENDKKIIDSTLKMDYNEILSDSPKSNNACSAGAVVSALATCKAMGSKKGALVDYYTSYDISQDASFVGYMGIIL
jgi:AmmeMemoRadiSam system protein B